MSKGFRTNMHLEESAENKHRSKQYPCIECPKAFTQNDNLKNYLKIYAGKKPYRCNQCTKVFSEHGTLRKTHIRKDILVINVKPFS